MCETGKNTHDTLLVVWWLTCYRVASLNSNHPMLIHEDDCEIPLPCATDGGYTNRRASSSGTLYTGFLAVIQITRLYMPLYQALKSSFIHPRVLQNFDEQFRAKAMVLPEAYGKGSQAVLDTAAIPPIFSMLSAQFHLYRRNLTPSCLPNERAEALGRCTLVAQDTAMYISRSLHSPPKLESDKPWQTRVIFVASNMICLHLWRCMLVLCFRGDYDAALMCLHLSSAIGNTRRINVECGKNILFFLDHLLGRIRSGFATPQQLEQDEEMLAYVSADAQGSVEHAWVWTGNNITSPISPHSRGRPDEPMHDALPLRTTSTSPKDGPEGWDNWARIEHMIMQLKDESRPRTATYLPAQHNPVKRVQLAPDTTSSPQPPTQSATPSSTSRISIANII